MDTKQCSKCREPKPLTAFNRCSAAKDGLQWQCRVCVKAYYKPSEVTEASRERSRQRMFLANLRERNLTLQAYDDLLEAQGHVCALCGQGEMAKRRGRIRRLCIDHDHVTGRVRALLCNKCNALLGQADDLPERLRSAADYLERHHVGRKTLQV